MNYLSRRLLLTMDAHRWYPLLSKVLNIKFLINQNKYIYFYSELPPCGHISPSHFRKINWLPVKCRVELCTSITIFKCWKGIVSSYLNDMLSLNHYNTRLQMTLDIPLCRTKICCFFWSRDLE